MGRRKKTGFNRFTDWSDARRMNNEQYEFYYTYLKQLAMAIFKWEGLPPEIDQRFLELCLYERGLSVFFYAEDYEKYFACSGSPNGSVNMYNNPTAFIAYGASGFRRMLTADQCVPIWNNYLRLPEALAMRVYARRLANIDRTIDVNLFALKSPIFMNVPEAKRLTVQKLMRQYSGNEPIILGIDGLVDPKDMTYISPDVPNHVIELYEAKQTVWSEIMTYFGIDNTNIQKAERVQAAEVRSNNGQIEASRLTRLNIRREACKEINRKYHSEGLEVWVDYNRDISSDNYAAIMGNPSMGMERGEL